MNREGETVRTEYRCKERPVPGKFKRESELLVRTSFLLKRMMGALVTMVQMGYYIALSVDLIQGR